MAHRYRFYLPSLAAGEDEAVLSGEEAHHAHRVVRARQGDPVVLFDGQGRELFGTVSRAAENDFRVAVDACVEHPRPARTLTVGQGWPNREKSLEDLIRRGTELGVSCFRFFKGDHSERNPRVLDKWTRLAVETCKQCRRVWLPAFEVEADLAAVLGKADGIVLIATPDHPPIPLRKALEGASAVTVLVGPEGGFSGGEADLALGQGAIPISLGSATFRSEVAGSLASALILYELGELGPLV